MLNVFNPARYANESRVDYVERRKTAQQAVRRATLPGYGGDKTGRELHRDAMRKSGSMRVHAGAFGRGMRNHINVLQKRARAAA